MWFTSALLCTELLLVACTLIGLGVIRRCLPWRLRPAASLFLGPVVGLAVLVLVATATGWLTTGGYRQWFCAGCTLALAGGGGWTVRREPRLARGLAGTVGFGLVAAYPPLSVVLRWDAFNPYNDAIFYLTHSQWLQRHGFREQSADLRLHPILTYVHYFQDGKLKMGASFFLGWVQALFGSRWSVEIYPPVVALAQICGALTVGAVVAMVCPRRRLEAWLAALVAAVTINGFTTGMVTGFLSQTFGVALAAGAFALRGMEASQNTIGTAAGRRWHLTLAQAICLAATIFCYSEMTPFLAAALALSYLWPRWDGWRERGAAAGRVVVLTLALTNLEWGRVIHAIFQQMSGQPGLPLNWQWWEYPAHSLGLQNGPGGGWLPVYSVSWLRLTLALGAMLVFVWTYRPSHWQVNGPASRWLPLWPGAVLCLLYVLAFLIFRYLSPSPWPDPPDGTAHYVGNSFRQYRLGCWGSLTMFSLALPGLIVLGQAGRSPGRVSVLILLTLWCACGLAGNALQAKRQLVWLQTLTGQKYHAFAGYEAMRDAAEKLPRTDLIYLDMPAVNEIKNRQLLSYFLMDRPIVSDWSNDGSVQPELADLPPLPAPDRCRWIISYDPPGAAAGRGTGQSPGYLVLRRNPAAD